MGAVLAGCGGGGGGSAVVNPPPTRVGTLARFDVDVKTGKVSVSSVEDPSNPGRVIATGTAISFTSSDLLSVDGDSGKRLVRVTVNNKNVTEIGSLAGARLVVTNLANTGYPQFRGDTITTTYAGTGSAGSANGFRTSASFNQPSDVLEFNGELYVVDTLNHAIRKIDKSGAVTTFAGSPGVQGFADGQGTTARFNRPEKIIPFPYPSASFLVADTGNHCIRRLKLDGTVTTIIGTGELGNSIGTGDVATFGGPTGMAVYNDFIYVVDRLNNNVRRVYFNRDLDLNRPQSYEVHKAAGHPDGVPGYVNGSGDDVRFNGPTQIHNTNDGLLISDTGNHALRRLDPFPGSTVGTAYGEGVPGNTDGAPSSVRFTGPVGLTFAGMAAGNLALVTERHQIRGIVYGNTGTYITTFTGSNVGGYAEGDGTEARLSAPAGMSAVPSGAGLTLYVADPGNNRIRKVQVGGSGLHSGGAGTPEQEPVRILNADGEVPNRTAWFKTLAAGQPADLQFYVPTGVIGFSFTAYVEVDTSQVNLPAVGAAYLTTVAGDGHAGLSDGPGKLAQFNGPYGVAAVPAKVRAAVPALAKIRAFVADADNHLVRFVDVNGNVGTYAGSVEGFVDGVGTSAQFRRPRGLALSSDGTLFVADTDNHRIRRITPERQVTTVAGQSAAGNQDGPGNTATLQTPEGIAADAGGSVYVTSLYAHTVRRIRYVAGDPALSASWSITTVAGLAGSAGFGDGTGSQARLSNPAGIAADTDGRLYVADVGNRAIRILARSGPNDMTVATLATALGEPTGIAVDAAHNLYVTEYSGNLVKRVSPQGAVVTLIGTAGPGFTEGATGQFQGPRHIAVEDSGTLLVTDYGNRALRSIQRVISAP
jgi:sugar lactone lactonase YvrE